MGFLISRTGFIMPVINVHKSIVPKRTRCTREYFSEAARHDETKKKMKTRLPWRSIFRSGVVVVKILYGCGEWNFVQTIYYSHPILTLKHVQMYAVSEDAGDDVLYYDIYTMILYDIGASSQPTGTYKINLTAFCREWYKTRGHCQDRCCGII